MLSLTTVAEAQHEISDQLKKQRLSLGFTQSGLSKRSGVSLASLRKFEQQGVISFESLLKLAQTLGLLDQFINSLKAPVSDYKTIDDVINDRPIEPAKRGWRN